MKKTIERGEKIMKGRFFTLIIGLSLVVGNVWGDNNTPPKIASGSIPVNIYGGGYSITLPTQTFDLSKNGGSGSTGTSVSCRTPIPGVEYFKVAAGIHAVNKYTQLQTTRTTFDYLKTMGIYNGTSYDVKFNKNGSIASYAGVPSMKSPGYWGIQAQMIDAMASNPIMAMMMMGGSTGLSGGNLGGTNLNMWSMIGGSLR